MSFDPPPHLSPSSWNLWDECNRKWAAKYHGDIVGPPTLPMESGSYGHKVLEVVYTYSGPLRTIDNAREVAGQLWNDALHGYPRDRLTTVTSGQVAEIDFKQAAWAGVVGDFKIEDPPNVQVVAIEHHAKWIEYGVTFYCIIDRVDRGDVFDLPGLVSNDFKTGKLPKKKEYGKPYERQVVVEAMGCAATIGPPADRGNLLYTTAGKIKSVDTSLKARTAVAKEAVGVWDQMRAAAAVADTWQDYEPNPGHLCYFCPASEWCPEGRRFIETAVASDWRYTREHPRPAWMTPTVEAF